MHGRPRKAPTQEEQDVYALKAVKLRALQSQFLEFHHNNIYSKEGLEVSTKLLEANPEYYTAWNYRKLAVEHNLNQFDANADADRIKSILDDELRLVENALKKNYKSYGAWHHRKWVLSKGQSSTDREMLLLCKFQKLDARNFHAWNYRRFITTLKNIPDVEELHYTTDMIYDNFSNYSAWHNRSFLLSRLLEERAEGYFPKENVLTEEYDFVRNALFTDPDDQSGWFYYLWLLDQTVKVENLLVSSWPCHGSTVHLSKIGSQYSVALSPIFNYQTETRTFPFILYFSEPVEGVNSSTVTVEYEYGGKTDVTWTPLSANKNCRSQAWLAYLDLPDDLLSSNAFQVKASLPCSQGIISSSGVYHSHCSPITFTLHVPPHNSENVEGHIEERISWALENFSSEEAELKECHLSNLFHQVIIKEDERPGTSEWNLKTISNEIDYCRDLLSTMDCKIGKLTLARLLMAHQTLVAQGSVNDQNVIQYEVLELYNDLMKLDPPRYQYYQDHHSLVLLKKVTSGREFLKKYCHQYEYSTSPSINKYSCVRLNNLSLSRIGSVERLLWVQMLDLSHNQLRSIEGLEALQLLVRLNLSHNKLSSFTALEPLRLLKALKVLDISHNEIGAHTIDTRRYLCTSPLTHGVGSGWNISEYEAIDFKATKYWEAFLTFRDMNLTQLDIIGNAAASENLKSFLLKLMPTLEWLDGESSR